MSYILTLWIIIAAAGFFKRNVRQMFDKFSCPQLYVLVKNRYFMPHRAINVPVPTPDGRLKRRRA